MLTADEISEACLTNEEFAAWRKAKGLSQQDAADLLGASSRFVVMRWEAGTELPTSIAARIIEADAALAAAKPGEKPKGGKKLKTKGLPSQVILAPSGRRVAKDYPHSLTLNQIYWKYDWVDPENGHHMFNLYQIGRDHDLQYRGLCTPIRLDVHTWTARQDFMFGGDEGVAIKSTVDKLNEVLAAARANPPQSLEDTIKPNDKENEAPFTQEKPADENKPSFFA